MLNWLYQETTDKRHTEISGRRQKNTGQWILGAPEVQGWAKKNSNSRLLWGYGIRMYKCFSYSILVLTVTWVYSWRWQNILMVYSLWRMIVEVSL